MEVVFVLLPLALLVAAIMLGFFIWAVRSGQFDDLDSPAQRILLDPNDISTTADQAGDDDDRPADEGARST